MSIAALDWAFKTTCPSASSKLVLLVYCNFPNEDGRAYPSAETVARLSGLNVKTVRSSIDALEDAGLLQDTGRRVGRTSNVKVYRIAMESHPEVGALPGEIAGDASPAAQEGTGEAAGETHPETGAFDGGAKAPVFGGKGTQKRVAEPVREPTPPEAASAASAPQGAKTGSSGKANGKGWTPPAIIVLPPEIRAIVEQWPAGAYNAEGAGHAAWLAGRRRRGDPDASWHARIVQIGAKPLRDAKAGLRHAPAAAPASPAAERAIAACGTTGEGEAAAQLRAQLRDRFHEDLYRQWFEPCRFDFNDDGVNVVAPSGFILSYLKQNWVTLVEYHAAAVMGRDAFVSWEVGQPA